MTKHTTKISMFFFVWLLSGCCVFGSGDIEEELYVVNSFEKVTMDVPGTVYIAKGDSRKITVRSDDNILEQLNVEVRHHTLFIEPDQNNRCLDPTVLKVYVTTPSLIGVNIDGSGDVVIEDSFQADAMKLSIDGSGDISGSDVLIADRMNVNIDGSGSATLTVDVAELTTSIDGSGDVKLTGSAISHDINIDGSGNIDAYGLITDYARIDVDGSGDCSVTVNETLDIKIDGSGNVFYRGTADVRRDIDGSGTIRNKN